jgi:hypothetical protein
MWEVAVISAAPSETPRHLRNPQTNRIVIVGLSVRYQGPGGEVSRPTAALFAEDGQEVGEFRTAGCRGDDKPCMKNFEWLNGIGRHSSHVLSQGEALSAGSLEYWFEVPRSARELQLRFGDARPVRVVVGTKSH